VLRRILPLSLALLLAWPALAFAAPSVKDLVTRAVQAVHTQCYEARMRFLSQMDGGTEQVVRVYHVAPDLFRVEPLINGEPGQLAYIENAEELVRITLGKNLVEQMPQRQFSLNDSLTVTFLRMLSERAGTTVLNGMVGSYSVYVLRQDSAKNAPYTITVGVDQKTTFPVFLSVRDERGRTRVYYEMEAIEYVTPHQLRDELFNPPKSATHQKMPAPRAPSAKGPSATQTSEAYSVPDEVRKNLPLYPNWLPKGYRLEAISVLRYTPSGSNNPATVFQLEAFGPNNDLISIFQTKSSGVDIKVSDTCNEPDCGFAMRERDGWIITVIGQNGMNVLLKIADAMGGNEHRVLQLLRQTSERDRILDQFDAD
jgi:hypothetical protein